MTTSTIKVKVVRRPTLKLKVYPKFPANVLAKNFVTVTASGSTYTFGVDYTVLPAGPISDPTTAYVAVQDQTAGQYRTVTLASLLTSGLDQDLQVIAALTGSGILARTGANTWSLRAITGTANEITVTNGDGVAGAPTVSLPAALTFTGKTITGGTFNSPAMVTPALGTPASGVATNLTGTASGLTAGNVTTNANLTGPVTSVGNATSVTANAITNAMRAQMAAFTLKGNATGSTANEADIDITALTLKAAPVSADIVLIQDSAAANAFKKATIGTLASAGSVSSIAGNTGAFTLSNGIKNVTNDIQADPLIHRSYLAGLTLSTAGSSATFGIAAGVAVDSTNAGFMVLASAYTKTTAAWALGTAAGSLDSGSIAASTWYHAFLIKRTDTGVVDVLVSLSATAPTMPTNYTLFRRIGSMKTNGSSQWTAFTQNGDNFYWASGSVPQDTVALAITATATLLTLSVPTGVNVTAMINVLYTNTAGAGHNVLLASPVAGVAVNTIGGNVSIVNPTANGFVGASLTVLTNTSAQIYGISDIATTNSLYVTTPGWIDSRGKLN